MLTKHTCGLTAARASGNAQQELARSRPRYISGHFEKELVLVSSAIDPGCVKTLDLGLNDTFDQFGAQSIQYRVILGANAGTRTLTLRNSVQASSNTTPKPFTASRDGFSLNAAVAAQPHQRKTLERLCRYVARPPLALERFSVTEDGKLRYALKHPYSNGTTHFLFEPLDFMAKLAALVPRPRVNLVRYHGVFAPNSKFRARIVPARPTTKDTKPQRSKHNDSQPNPRHTATLALSHAKPLTWAERLKRTFEFDVTICALCGGSLRVIADITQPDLIEKILGHIRQTRAPPAKALPHGSTSKQHIQRFD